MTPSKPVKPTYAPYLAGGGEMGQLTRDYNWEDNILGSPDGWSQSLLTTISIMFKTRFPMFLWWGPELIQFYNDAYRPSLGIDGKHPAALGQRGEDCWPEIWPVIKPLIDQVMAGGDGTWSEDQLIPIYRNNSLEDVYWTFGYSSVIDETGKPAGVLVVCHETTEKVKTLEALQDSRKEVEIAQIEAERQRDRLINFFMEVPAGVCILDGPEMIFELINPGYQQLFPGRALLGKPVLEALPEIKGQPVEDILKDVYTSGQIFEGKELLIPLARTKDGPLEDRYFNFIYQPRHNHHGNVDGIMVFVFEVTDMVATKKELEAAGDTLKLSLLAAELGTFDLDLVMGTMYWDDRCRTLFGISHNNTVTYEEDFVNGLHPDDKDRILKIIDNVFIKEISNGDYDVEYRTVGAEDQKVRWLRAKGKAYFDDKGKPLRFVGAVLDITEQKSDELRKNDFIGMVSHELKTPLTSINAYVQLLLAKSKKQDDPFAVNALEKTSNQLKKMNAMINGFLDISRLEAGKIQLDKQVFELDALIREAVDETALTTPGHNIIFEKCDPVVVNADRDKIGSVISNLLSNAVKYSPKGKNILVKCVRQEAKVMVSVKDEGIGINQQDKEKLFARYYRVQNTHTRHISGFGIGLYLSAEIVERHSGKIWIDSEPGMGATFFFTLPITDLLGGQA